MLIPVKVQNGASGIDSSLKIQRKEIEKPFNLFVIERKLVKSFASLIKITKVVLNTFLTNGFARIWKDIRGCQILGGQFRVRSVI